MELRYYADVLRERWLIALLTALAVLAAVVGATLLQTPSYTAKNRLYVQTQAGSTVTELQQGATFARQQITSYADLAKSPLVLEPVIEDLDLQTTSSQLASSISTTVPPDTLILEISAASEDPEAAARIANATAESLAEQVAQLETTDGQSRVTLTTIAPATVPASPASPNIPRNIAVGVVLAILAGLGAALLRDVLDNRVRRPADITETLGRPLIASIPMSRDAKHYPLIASQHPRSLQAEAFRELRTNLQFVGLDRNATTLLTTSALPAEGKSSTSINLAHVLAQSGAKVLLIDADLRRPSLSGYLGVVGSVGLTTVLIGDADLQDVVQPLEQQGLDLLASGAIPPNPSEILGSVQMAELLQEAQRQYDYVIVDTAPLLAVTDAAVLSKLVGGVVVVMQAERVRRPQAMQALAKLDAVEAPLLGIVLNRLRNGSRGAYSYQYEYRSKDAPAAEAERPSAPAAHRGRTAGARTGRRRQSTRSAQSTWPPTTAGAPAPAAIEAPAAEGLDR